MQKADDKAIASDTLGLEKALTRSRFQGHKDNRKGPFEERRPQESWWGYKSKGSRREVEGPKEGGHSRHKSPARPGLHFPST